jgi:hypothetical protein
VRRGGEGRFRKPEGEKNLKPEVERGGEVQRFTVAKNGRLATQNPAGAGQAQRSQRGWGVGWGGRWGGRGRMEGRERENGGEA